MRARNTEPQAEPYEVFDWNAIGLLLGFWRVASVVSLLMLGDIVAADGGDNALQIRLVLLQIRPSVDFAFGSNRH